MSEINNPAPVVTSAPVAAPSDNAAVDAYRRAVTARPTDFAENPIGAMASAMDKLGKAAGNIFSKGPQLGQDGLGPAEQALAKASAAVKANPGSLQAKQEQLKAALNLLQQMQGLAPNDPRRVKVSAFIVNLANELGPSGIPFDTPGLDVRGMLRLAAQVTSRYGDANGMQKAFSIEQILRQSIEGSSVAAVELRDQLISKFRLTPQAQALLVNGWKVRLTGAGELPSLDISSRTLALNAQQDNPNLGVLARAYWHDASLQNPADKDGFMAAFLKIANSGGFQVLNRRYKEFRNLARHEMSRNRSFGAIGSTIGAPVSAVSGQPQQDESDEMFAALAVWKRSDDESALPETVQPVLSRFMRQ